MDKRKKRRRQFIVTCGNAAEIFEPLEKAFDLIAVFVSLFAVLLRVSLVFARRNTGDGATILNICEDFSRIVTPVS